MHTAKPLITICIPTFNRAGYLTAAIQSALDQTRRDFEILIVDDGSDDDTRQVVESFTDSRLRYLRNETNQGRPITRNRAIRETRTDYILWLDDDDLLADTIVDQYVSLLKQDSTIDIIYCNLQLFEDESGQDQALIEAKDWSASTKGLLASLVNGVGITNLGSCVRKALYDEIGFYDEAFLRAQDYEFWARAARTAIFHKVNSVLARCRRHTGNISLGPAVDRSYESLAIRKIAGAYPLQAIFPDLDWSHPEKARPEALYQMAHNLLRVQDPYNAACILKESLADGFYPQALHDLVRCCLILGQPDEGKVWLARFESDGLGEDRFYRALRKTIEGCLASLGEFEKYLAERQYGRADRVLDQLYAQFGPLYAVEILTAEYLEKADKPEQAGKHYELALQINPNPKLLDKVLDQTETAHAVKHIRARYARITQAIRLCVKETLQVQDVLASVVIPTYNRPAMLKEAITSVLQQTCRDFEIIVVNDAGENVAHIIDELNTAGNIHYIELPENLGMAAARNAGIKKALGKYIALLDDDDLFYPYHLETALAHLNDQTAVVYTDAMRATYRNVDGNYQLAGRKVPYSIDFDRNALYIGNISPVNCFVFKRGCAMQAGLFDETYPVLEDWEFFIRLAAQNSFKHIARVTVQVNWRTDGTTTTSSRGADFKKSRERIYKRYRDEIERIPNPRAIHRMFQKIWKEDGQPGEGLTSIVILAHNQLEYTRKCIASIVAHTRESYEIIVVDNGSTDGTDRYLETELAGLISAGTLKIVTSETNRGYAGGNNLGIAVARGAHILLLNNDVVVTPGWLARLLVCMEKNEDVGIVGPMTNHVAGPQLVKPVPYNTDSLAGLDAFAAEQAEKSAGQIKRIARVVGFCMLIKREVVDKIGGLDSRYGLGNFEDDDFSLRAVLAGYGSCIARDCFIHHFGNRTFEGEKIDYRDSLLGNWEIFKLKWGLPQDLPYGAAWEIKDVIQGGFVSAKHFVPIEDGDSPPDDGQTPTVPGGPEMPGQKGALAPAAEKMAAGPGHQRATAMPTLEKGDSTMTNNGQPANTPETEAALIAYLEEKLQGRVNAAVIHNDLGIMYCRRGENEKARDHFRAAADANPENGDYLKNLGDFYYSIVQDSREALAVYKRLLTLDPVDVTVLTILGHIHLAGNQTGEARVYYRRILELDPGNAEIRKLLESIGRSRAKSGETQPDDSAETLYGKIQPFVDQGDKQGACEQLEKLVAAYPGYALAYNDLGVLYYQAGNKEKSLAAYQRAVDLEPQNITFKKNLADFQCIELNRIEEAVGLYNEILAIEPDDLETLLALGQVCAMLGKKEDAIHFFDQALAVEPWSAEIRQLLEAVERGAQAAEKRLSADEMYTAAQRFAEKGQADKAVARLTELAAANPDMGVAHNDLGVLYYQAGDMQAAEKHYEKAVEIEPDNTVFRKNLADFYCVAQGQLEKGMQIYVDLLAQMPDDVEVLTTLGQICERLEKPDDAHRFYELALNAEPWNPQIRELAGTLKSA